METNKPYLIHPQILVIYLLLGSMSSLFLGFSAAFMYNRIQANLPPLDLPPLFYFNTLILIASSFTLMKAKSYYLSDQTKNYKGALVLTLLFSILFLGLQLLAWKQLMASGITLTYSNMAAYMYVISFIHLLHLVGGIPFLGLFLYTAITKMREPVSVLVYFSDDTKERRLRILTIYWHFLDILWIYLVLFFLLNFLIK